MNKFVSKTKSIFMVKNKHQMSTSVFSACEYHLDLEITQLKRGAVKASSYEGPNHAPQMAGLLGSDLTHAWCSADNVVVSYLQIDLGTLRQVTGITTEGMLTDDPSKSALVTEYMVQYSNDGHNWTNFTEKGVLKVYLL